MTKKVKLELTETFANSAERLIDYLSAYKSETAVIEEIENLIGWFEDNVTQFPEMHRICQDLTLIGEFRFREAIKGEFRLLYSIDETEEEIIVTAEVLIRTKNDIRDQLIDYCLLYR